jgi:hypothetical protein
MKIKVLIFLSLFVACRAGNAQSFSLFYHDIKLAGDAALTRTGTPDTLEMTTWLTIRNDAATEKQIQAKKTEVIMATGAACSLCWAGYCYPTEIFQTDNPLVLAPGASETSCFAHFITGGTVGTSIVRWTYFDKDDPEDSVSVIINYITYPTGIAGPGPGVQVRVQASPNPADKEIFFRLTDPTLSTYTITLCTISGQAVLDEKVSVSAGSLGIDTSVLPGGIYVYSLNSGGKMLGSGKIVICH